MTDLRYQNVAVDRARFISMARKSGPFPSMTSEQFIKPYCSGGFVAEDDNKLWAINPVEYEVVPITDHVPHGARKVLRSGFAASINQQFTTVMNECAKLRVNSQFRDRWLTQKLALGFLEMHRQGFAHSIEILRNDRLVGGCLFVQIGGLAISLSAFSTENGAGKMALVKLNRELLRYDFDLHLGSLPSNISRFWNGSVRQEKTVGPILRRAVRRNLAIVPQPAILLSPVSG